MTAVGAVTGATAGAADREGNAAGTVDPDVVAAALPTAAADAFLKVYYPTPGLDVPGESGHTPRMYLHDMQMYMDLINAAA